MNATICRPISDGASKHNAAIRAYPDGVYRVTCFSMPVYLEAGLEDVDAEWKRRRRKEFEAAHADFFQPAQRDRQDNLRRAKQAIYDLACLNDWTYFVTLTLDQTQIDRYNPEEIGRRVGKWLANMVQRRKGFAYVVVPEHHEDGAIHFHGLIMDGLNMVDSGTVKVPGRKKPIKRATAKRLKIPEEDQHTVYNVTDFPLGFSTAIPTYGERQHLAGYMTKYITKDLQKIFGHRYWAGGDLRRKPRTVALDLDFENLAGEAYTVPGGFGQVKYVLIPSREALNDFLLALLRTQLMPAQARGLFDAV